MFVVNMSSLNYVCLSVVALCFSVRGLFQCVGVGEVLFSDVFLLLL